MSLYCSMSDQKGIAMHNIMLGAVVIPGTIPSDARGTYEGVWTTVKASITPTIVPDGVNGVIARLRHEALIELMFGGQPASSDSTFTAELIRTDRLRSYQHRGKLKLPPN